MMISFLKCTAIMYETKKKAGKLRAGHVRQTIQKADREPRSVGGLAGTWT